MVNRKGRGKIENKGMIVITVVTLLILAGYMQIEWMQGENKETIKRMPSQKVPCPHCEGKGRLPNPEDVPSKMDCPYCFGVGFRYVHQLGKSFTICPTCIGMGRELYRTGGHVQSCNSCNGYGVVKKEYPGLKFSDEIEEYPVEQKAVAPPTTTNKVEQLEESELRPF
jgi:RecJ-like exonuclease